MRALPLRILYIASILLKEPPHYVFPVNGFRSVHCACCEQQELLQLPLDVGYLVTATARQERLQKLRRGTGQLVRRVLLVFPDLLQHSRLSTAFNTVFVVA